MGEFLPLFLGVGIGLLGGRMLIRRRILTVALCVVAGASAAWINGELAEPALILFDTAQALAAVVMTVAVMRRVTA
jgi:hypothetical protein